MLAHGRLGRQEAVEAQIAVAREVDEQGQVAVGERGGDMSFRAKLVQARPDVRPRVEPVRPATPPLLGGQGQSRALGQKVVERREIEHVEVTPRPFALVHLVEDGRVCGARQRVGQLLQDRQALRSSGTPSRSPERQSTSVPKTSNTSALTAIV